MSVPLLSQGRDADVAGGSFQSTICSHTFKVTVTICCAFTVTLLYPEQEKTDKRVRYFVSLTVASEVYDEFQTDNSIGESRAVWAPDSGI